jgi:hypothetical protein
MNKYTLSITESEEDGPYTFQLTEAEIMSIGYMPYKKPGTNEPSHIRLKKAKIDAYRLGNDFHIMYDNNEKGSVYTDVQYNEIKLLIGKAVDEVNLNGAKSVSIKLKKGKGILEIIK